MARILHDWDDSAAIRILKRAREALDVGNEIFVIEMVLPEAGVAGALCDLHLLMVTGGQERTEAGYASSWRLRGLILSRYGICQPCRRSWWGEHDEGRDHLANTSVHEPVG